ncbi:NlpC/P60 family protein [Corynebacterium glyciniphilum]|uniref:NlpC/P60 family protein n=1 Tax=Corynebacterium glyciniphilum TaxID=1404244 RepID=UPI0011AB7D7F|nr:NlpC/P60 family protein [Corynebacterium glyciniphilum]
MGKHRMKKDHSRRNAVAVAAVGMGAVIALPATAQAVTVEVPNTDISVDVPNEAVDFAKQHVDVDPFLAAADQVSAPISGGSDAVSAPSSVGQKIADAALSKQGAPYSWGAAGPNAFDCSGLTSWAHQQVGKSIPRTSGEQAASGTPVSIDALQPGDVVSYYSGASHVAIYIGDGKVVQALNEGSPVQVNDLNYMPVNNAVRF